MCKADIITTALLQKSLHRYHSAKSDNCSFHTEKSQLKKSAKNNFFCNHYFTKVFSFV